MYTCHSRLRSCSLRSVHRDAQGLKLSGVGCHCKLTPSGVLMCRRAWEALGQKDGGRLRAGLDLAKKLQRAIVQCVLAPRTHEACSMMQVWHEGRKHASNAWMPAMRGQLSTSRNHRNESTRSSAVACTVSKDCPWHTALTPCASADTLLIGMPACTQGRRAHHPAPDGGWPAQHPHVQPVGGRHRAARPHGGLTVQYRVPGIKTVRRQGMQ